MNDYNDLHPYYQRRTAPTEGQIRSTTRQNNHTAQGYLYMGHPIASPMLVPPGATSLAGFGTRSSVQGTFVNTAIHPRQDQHNSQFPGGTMSASDDRARYGNDTSHVPDYMPSATEVPYSDRPGRGSDATPDKQSYHSPSTNPNGYGYIPMDPSGNHRLQYVQPMAHFGSNMNDQSMVQVPVKDSASTEPQTSLEASNGISGSNSEVSAGASSELRRCSSCGAGYTGKYCDRNLKRHVEAKHPTYQSPDTTVDGEKIWKCTMCNKMYHRKDALLKHERTHPELMRSPPKPRRPDDAQS